MLKKNLIITISCITIILMIVMCGNVFAADEHTSTSTINGVTVNWSYELNDANQIKNLKCTNPAQVTGDITIPSTLDGKKVVSLGEGAFKSATNITKVTIPSSITTIESSAFEKCTSLSSIDLGSIQSISHNVFKGCTSLKSITIPKTLKAGSTTPCLNNSNITNITLEEGLTVVPSSLCANTGITSITIPKSVTSIENNAFENCTNLSNVNLGSIKSISFNVFKGCTSLKSITIPKTLKDGSVAACLNNINITKITLEEGLTVVPANLCANTGITSITIPNSVTKIEQSAFENTGITSITIPKSVTNIENDVFTNCKELNKVTILGNITNLGFFSIRPTVDSVFKNHNENLTIHCYEGSLPVQYAINNKIKYVYLTKPTEEKPSEEKPTEEPNKDNENTLNGDNNDTTKDTNQKDNTVATGELPKTGVSMAIGVGILAIILFAIVYYKKYSNYKDIE